LLEGSYSGSGPNYGDQVTILHLLVDEFPQRALGKVNASPGKIKIINDEG
jgi:hypothetical protein